MALALTKSDVARRQLRTAIQLLFQSGDAVSVFSLAANAWEVVDALCVAADVASMSVQARDHVRLGSDLRKDYINAPYRNFFKHADRDPDAVLEDFDEQVVDHLLFLAVEDYVRLHRKSPIEFQVFQLWYLACHTEKIAPKELADIMVAIDNEFPGIKRLDRAGQLALANASLESELLNQELLLDPKTERV